jgi:hypothetical protein
LAGDGSKVVIVHKLVNLDTNFLFIGEDGFLGVFHKEIFQQEFQVQANFTELKGKEDQHYFLPSSPPLFFRNRTHFSIEH